MTERKWRWLPVSHANPNVALHPNPNSTFAIDEIKKRLAKCSDEDRPIYEELLKEFEKQ